MSKPHSSFLSFICSALIWIGLLLALYFAGDIVAKGQALNALTPFPLLGVCLWVGVVAVIVWWLVLPIASFARLKRALHADTKSTLKSALKALRKQKEKTPEEMELQCAIAGAIEDPNGDKSEENMHTLYDRYRKIGGLHKKSKELIVNYSKVAGIAVVVSRNNWLDGLILLVLQMKLVVELARLHGFRPSPVFNSLCFAWVVSNSIINALLAQQASAAAGEMAKSIVNEAAESCAELIISDELPVTGVEGAFAAIPAVGNAISVVVNPIVRVLLEAFFAGSTVYVTGRIFLMKLEGELASFNARNGENGKRLTFRSFLKIRKEARKELFHVFLAKFSNIKKLRELHKRSKAESAKYEKEIEDDEE